MRSNEDIFFDYDFAEFIILSGTPIQMTKYGRSITDRASVSYLYRLGMQFINIDRLAHPHVVSNSDASHSMEPYTKSMPSRCDEGQSLQDAMDKIS
jgi:phage gp29-like protein